MVLELVNGSSTYVYSENLVIKDPLIKLADQNSTDNLDSRVAVVSTIVNISGVNTCNPK